MRHVLRITGMHHYGTSLTTSWIEHCNLPIHDGKFIGPHVGNQMGHFDDNSFRQLQSAAILSESPLSNNWKILADRFLPFRTDYLSTAINLVAE